MNKKFFLFVINFFVILFFLWLSFDNIEFHEIINTINDTTTYAMYWILLAIFFSILSNVIRTIKWHVLFQQSGLSPKIYYIYLTIMIGYAVNTVIPQGGEVTKPLLLSKLNATPIKNSVLVSALDRFLDLLIFFMVFLLFLILYYDKFYVVLSNHPSLQASYPIFIGLLIFLCAGGIVGLLSLFVFPKRIIYFIQETLFKRVSFIRTRIEKMTEPFIELATNSAANNSLPKIFFLSFLIWGCFLMSAYSILIGMNITTTYHVSFLDTIAILTISAISAIITPSGLGSYQYGMTQTLVLLFQVPMLTATTYSLLTFSISIACYGMLGFVCWIILFILKGKHLFTLTKN